MHYGTAMNCTHNAIYGVPWWVALNRYYLKGGTVRALGSVLGEAASNCAGMSSLLNTSVHCETSTCHCLSVRGQHCLLSPALTPRQAPVFVCFLRFQIRPSCRFTFHHGLILYFAFPLYGMAQVSTRSPLYTIFTLQDFDGQRRAETYFELIITASSVSALFCSTLLT